MGHRYRTGSGMAGFGAVGTPDDHSPGGTFTTGNGPVSAGGAAAGPNGHIVSVEVDGTLSSGTVTASSGVRRRLFTYGN